MHVDHSHGRTPTFQAVDETARCESNVDVSSCRLNTLTPRERGQGLGLEQDKGKDKFNGKGEDKNKDKDKDMNNDKQQLILLF